MERAFHARKEGSGSSESVYCFIIPTDRLGIKGGGFHGKFLPDFGHAEILQRGSPGWGPLCSWGAGWGNEGEMGCAQKRFVCVELNWHRWGAGKLGELL